MISPAFLFLSAKSLIYDFISATYPFNYEASLELALLSLCSLKTASSMDILFLLSASNCFLSSINYLSFKLLFLPISLTRASNYLCFLIMSWFSPLYLSMSLFPLWALSASYLFSRSICWILRLAKSFSAIVVLLSLYNYCFNFSISSAVSS